MKRNKATKKKKNKKTLKKVCQLKKSFYIYSIKQETKKQKQ